MSTITKEFAQDIIRGHGYGVTPSAVEALARIALTSLEVEPVAYMYKDNLHADARFSLHTRFGNWSQEDINEYEITEIPLYTAPPAPVSVPDAIHSQGEKSASDDYYALGWNACRAAMLQGADGNSQVMNDYPETLPCPVSLEPGLKLGKGVATKILLEALQSRANYSAEIEVIKEVCRDIKDGDFLAAAKINSSSELVTTAYKLPKPIKDHRLNSGPDADDYYAGYQAGWNDSIGEAVICNSPVIPDGWVACSEQMPEQFKAILAFNEYGEVWSGAYDRYWNFYCDNLLVEHVTHWMPLPAAPQQEA
ncbi:TPA: DUF551 domain-containing protein [Enterobacter kobei]|nr:DUF551 domain-containing protein [Enterobacter kobei]HDC4610010.1 DUF551 domain-containing protein [Enterobacter kobei]HDC4623271.1 DUF551 domain-containing protein [Enterobacter kobei]HDR2359642.1 DUF551 domain-containing protein [Enterobacter kobei]